MAFHLPGGESHMVVLDATIVNVALPHIQQALGFPGSSLEWVVNAYAVTFGGLLLLGGRAGDILGRGRVFVLRVMAVGAVRQRPDRDRGGGRGAARTDRIAAPARPGRRGRRDHRHRRRRAACLRPVQGRHWG
jgi:hypothetical protein